MTWLSDLDEYDSDDALSSYTVSDDDDVLWRGATASPTLRRIGCALLRILFALTKLVPTQKRVRVVPTQNSENTDSTWAVVRAMDMPTLWYGRHEGNLNSCQSRAASANATRTLRQQLSPGHTSNKASVHVPKLLHGKDLPHRVDGTRSRSIWTQVRCASPFHPYQEASLHRMLTYKLNTRTSIPAQTNAGRGLKGTVAENVDRDRPEEVVVQPAGGGPTSPSRTLSSRSSLRARRSPWSPTTFHFSSILPISAWPTTCRVQQQAHASGGSSGAGRDGTLTLNCRRLLLPRLADASPSA